MSLKEQKPLLLIGGVFLFSVFLKLKDYKEFINKDNFLSCFDCFFYVRLSKEISQGVYFPIDYLRNVPDFVYGTRFPPLISIIPAYISKFTGVDLSYFFIFMPPIFSVLFIIPFYFWTKQFGKSHAYLFLGGAFLGIFNMSYYGRTILGRFDTDFLILFFVFSTVLFLTKAVLDKSNFYKYLILSAVVFNIFMWWYPKPILSLFFVGSLLLGLIVNRYNNREIILKVLMFILMINPSLVFLGLYYNLFAYIKGYVFKDISNIIPVSLSANISELRGLDWDRFVVLTTDNDLTAVLGIIGVLLLLLRFPKFMLVSLPFILLGFLSFYAGNRFLMYLSPFLGMGIGYLVYLATQYLKGRFNVRYRFITVFSLIVVLFLSFPPQRLYTEASPIIRQDLWDSLKYAEKHLDKRGYIWSWWDYGYVLEYLYGMGTYTDNGNIHPLKSYAFAHSMIISDEKKAKNIIAYVTNNLFVEYGTKIKTLADTLKFIEKAKSYNNHPNRPVYVFLFGGMLQKSVIHNLGSFGTGMYDKEMPAVSVFQSCELKDSFYDCGIFTKEKHEKTVHWKNRRLSENPPYKEIVLIDKDRQAFIIKKNENYPKNRVLFIVEKENEMFFIIMNYLIKDSILAKMFIYRKDMHSFELVFDDFPRVVIYKVK